MSVYGYPSTYPKFGDGYRKVFKSEVVESSFSAFLLPWGDVKEDWEPPFMVVYLDDDPHTNFSFKTKRGFLKGNAHVIYDVRVAKKYGLKVCEPPSCPPPNVWASNDGVQRLSKAPTPP